MHLHFHINVQHILSAYGYRGVFVILMVEMIGIPFPAETTLTMSGFEWAKGVFSLLPLLLAATFGNAVGSSIAYWIGRLLGRAVLLRFGKYVGITEERLQKAEAKFNQYKIPVLVFSKFIAGIRVLVPYLAGINRMPFLKFSIYNLISAFLWSGAFIVIGRSIGFAWKKYHGFLHHHMWPVVVILVLAVGVYLAIKQLKKNSLSKKVTE